MGMLTRQDQRSRVHGGDRIPRPGRRSRARVRRHDVSDRFHVNYAACGVRDQSAEPENRHSMFWPSLQIRQKQSVIGPLARANEGTRQSKHATPGRGAGRPATHLAELSRTCFARSVVVRRRCPRSSGRGEIGRASSPVSHRVLDRTRLLRLAGPLLLGPFPCFPPCTWSIMKPGQR
jgi:hypothetical protein